MKIHFIAIGGGVMHTLAIALKQKGDLVTGSDDEIFEPSLSRLKAEGLLPEKIGWFPEKITTDLDAVILGMHARLDNPELIKAKEIGLKIYSYPEYIYQNSLNKQRLVVAGSHGKTTTTSMILHVLSYHQRKFDYVIGATPIGFTSNVRLSDDAPLIVIEGDEYTTSPQDLTPKFLHYHHHIGIITGIGWDHINVYPDFNEYKALFEKFVALTPKSGILIHNTDDKVLNKIIYGEKNVKIMGKYIKPAQLPENVIDIPYQAHKAKVKNSKTYLITPDDSLVPVAFFGEHNLLNVNAAFKALLRVGITEKMFYEAIQSFKGTAKRLELIGENAHTKIFRDFAHAPSKLEATIEAVKKQFTTTKLVACMELHTYSSLNKNFIAQYKGTMKKADVAIVYYNPHTVALKRLEMLSEEVIKTAFGDKNIIVFTDSAKLVDYLTAQSWHGKNLLLMSSGNYDNIDLKQLSDTILYSNKIGFT
jgi:UDP-N-acetylmuramate: L-alanyl-gamma-D-glutamyl-meso-diaminopimelate ligase